MLEPLVYQVDKFTLLKVLDKAHRCSSVTSGVSELLSQAVLVERGVLGSSGSAMKDALDGDVEPGEAVLRFHDLGSDRSGFAALLDCVMTKLRRKALRV